MTDSNGSTIVPGGQQDDATALRTDDFGLNGDLQQQLVDALSAKWNPDDPGATELPDGPIVEPTQVPADTAATPVPAPDPSSTTAIGDGDGAGGGRAAASGEGAATQAPADDATPPASNNATPAAEEFRAGDYFDQYFGTPLDRAQAQELAGIIGGLQALSPQQRAALDATLAGRTPDAYPATMGQPVQQQAPQQQLADDPAAQILGPRPDDEYAAQQWDITARAVRYQAEQTAAIQQDIARQTQADQARQLAAAQAAIDTAERGWREQHTTLSDAEWDSLRDRAVRSQTFPGLLAAHHNDYNAAVTALYEQQFWADPNLREKAIANVASGRAAGTGQVDPNNAVAQQQATVDAGRQALASSVAGGGGSVTPQSSEVPRDPEKKKAAMIADLATHDFT